jgi:hypothetical protein
MTEIICKEINGEIEGIPPCDNIRKIEKGIIERCKKCGDEEKSQLCSYNGKIDFEPIKLTIEKWEYLAETGENVYSWDKFKDINKLSFYCGFGFYELKSPCFHLEKNIINRLKDQNKLKGQNCPFYYNKKMITERCFNGLKKKWFNAEKREERKKYASEILKMIRKVYPKN